ncbi:MAG: pectinesterase family protein [Clostridiales bacterium]|nr:pectinesterase family protein [Clostridiales bacterium]
MKKSFNLFKRIESGVLAFALCTGSVGILSVGAAQGSVITVGKGSGYDFNTITEALESVSVTPAKNSPLTIKIAEGTYEESFTVSLPYVSLVNEGKAEDVVITYDKAVGQADMSKRAGTEKTATVAVSAEAVGFRAENITFQNSYNLEQEEEYSQAVAITTSADMVTFEGCRFIGRQDTMYLKGASKGADVSGSANSARVYLTGCYIEGTIDFIFGDATAYFEGCDINMAYREGGGYFTAANTTLYNIGCVFDGCNFTVDSRYTEADAEYIYLGRPWQADADHPNFGSSVLIMNSSLPAVLNSDGFALWDETTRTDKVRFMEYNNTVKGAAENTAARAGYVKILTSAQAANFAPFNILRGNDTWNPGNFESVANSPGAEITLGSYEISVPKGESISLKAYVLPLNSKETEITYTSSNGSVVTVDKNGLITALSEGSAYITAALSNGMYARSRVTVTAARTEAPVVSEIALSEGSSLNVGSRLRASYSFSTRGDMSEDNSLLRWSAVDTDGNEYILTEGRGEAFKEYVVASDEKGCYIKFSVYPETNTSYGAVGEVKSAVTENTVSGENNVLISEGFGAVPADWQTGGSLSLVSDYDNKYITGASETNTAADRLISSVNISGGDFKAVLRERFNPEADGLSGDSYEDIFVNYIDENNYYKIRITRGGNTKSLRWYIIKSVGGVEETLVSDESSMSGNVLQNSGENNPFFKINIEKSGDKVTARFVLEETSAVLSTISAEYDGSLSKGTFGLEMYGKTGGILIDYIRVFGPSAEEKTETAARIFIAGDSTAKDYGTDNTIGGWGEYIPYYFSDEVEIINKAEGGRSSRSFMNQGRLDEICEEAHEGDYVFIQFGINDGQTEDNYRLEYSVALGEPDANGVYPSVRPTKVPTPQVLLDAYKDTGYPYGETYYPYDGGTFKWYLQQYVTRVRETGATPVLMTSICRVFFDSDGKITPHHGENDGYIKVVLQVAEEMDCDVIDFYEITKDLYESYGYMMVQGLANIKADGSMDLTHYNKFGANIIASKFAAAVKEAGIGLEDYVTASTADVERTDGLKSGNLWLVGDGYMADYSKTSADYTVERASLYSYMSEYLSSLLNVYSCGVEGASSKSYIETAEYTEFLNGLSAGDYVILHFGTNDKIPGEGYTSPEGDKDTAGSFQYYLYNYYVQPIKEKNAVPIIITPISAYSFENGEFVYTDGGYCDAARNLVSELQLYFCNMTENTAQLYIEAGEEDGRLYNAYDSEGIIIANSLSEIGAREAVKSFLSAMEYSSSTFKSYIQLPDEETIYFTKGEFAEKIVDAFGFTGYGLQKFADMPMGRSYVDACNILKENGIAVGDEENRFYPENLLTAETYGELMGNTAKALGVGTDIDFEDEIEGDFVTDREAMSGITTLLTLKN